MRKLLTLILFLALAYPANAVIFIQSAADSGGYDTTGITFWWRAEEADFTSASGTTDFSAGDKSGTLNSSATISTDESKMGTYAVDAPGAADYYKFDYSADIVTTAEGRVGMWVKFSSWTTQTTLFQMFHGAADNFGLRTSATTGLLNIRWESTSGTDTSDTTTTVIAIDTWAFVEFSWKLSNSGSVHTFDIWINGTDQSLGAETIVDLDSTPTIFQIGNAEASVGGNVFVDHIIITKDSTKSLFEASTQENYDNS